MHTVDGGQHWTTQNLPPSVVMHLVFIDQQHGWTWSNGGEISGKPVNGIIYKTDDGGSTWIKISTTNTNRSFTDLTLGALPYSLSIRLGFQTVQSGWAIEWFAPATADQRAYLYMTQDGGVTWTQQQLPQPTTGPIPGIHTNLHDFLTSGSVGIVDMQVPIFMTPQHGIVTIETSEKIHQPREAFVYETDDDGQTWSPMGSNIKDPSGALFPEQVIDATHILFWSPAGLATYAFDNGSWQKLSTKKLPAGTGENFVSFTNSQFGSIVAYSYDRKTGYDVSTLYMTFDGGQTWHAISQTTKNKAGGGC